MMICKTFKSLPCCRHAKIFSAHSFQLQPAAALRRRMKSKKAGEIISDTFAFMIPDNKSVCSYV